MKKKVSMAMVFGLVSLWASAQGIRITHGPYLQAVGEKEVTVVWTTDVDAVSWVELAPAGDESFYAAERPSYYQTRDGNRVVGKLHKITLEGLTKGTEYRYRVLSRAVLRYEGQSDVLYGQVAATNVYSRPPLRFRTLDGGGAEVAFTVVNDIHGRVRDLGDLTRNVVYGQADLALFNGDMVNDMEDETAFFAGFMDEAVNRFASEVPVFYARGNHETRGAFNVSFSSYFPTNTGKLYYSFRQGPVHFIILDSGEDKPDSDIEYSGLSQFDAYRSEQREWLVKELQGESFRTALYRLVIVHIPPVDSDWHGTMEVREKFLPVLRNAGITAMFCGHTHRYKYVEPGSLHDFPILVNAPETALDVKADAAGMTVVRKDTGGKELNRFYYPAK
ncbi:MAG: metallophosphoesterase family protein [Tannerella sp.]|nr:metallophosphoesterase family protein [Tannerella sp.]